MPECCPGGANVIAFGPRSLGESHAVRQVFVRLFSFSLAFVLIGYRRLANCWFLEILGQIGLEMFADDWQTSAQCIGGIPA